MVVIKAIAFLVPVLSLTACASTVPEAIRTAPAAPVSVAEVQREPARFLGQRVRWGGTILTVHNRERVTEIELLARTLSTDGEPLGDSSAQGRFIAELAGFVDPTDYPKDRLLTVSGLLDRVATREIGEYPYVFPIVAVQTKHLWPERRPIGPPYPYPYPWYDPWLSPWHPPRHPWWGPWYY